MGYFDKETRTERARAKFAENDPLRYQHALRTDRLDKDPKVEPEIIDLSWYLENPGELNEITDE